MTAKWPTLSFAGSEGGVAEKRAALRRPRLSGLALCAAALPATLWLLSTCFLGGNLGKWTDDYSVVKLDPTTGEIHYWDRWPVRRPLGNSFVLMKAGLLWNHDRANHLVSVVFHGAVALLYWLMLRQFSTTALAPAICALLFMLFPMHYEIIFWPSAMHAGMSVAAFFVLAMVYHRFANGCAGRSAPLLMAVLSLLIFALWEQPAAGLIALPLLYPAAHRARRSGRADAIRALAPVAACIALALVVGVLQRYGSPHGMRGGSGSFVAPADLGERCATVCRSIGYVAFGPYIRDIVCGGMIEGSRLLAGPRGLVWGSAVVVASGLWLTWWYRRPLGEGAPRAPHSQWYRIAFFGLAIAVLAWIPVVLVKSQTVDARLLYFPLAGVLMATCAVLDRAAVKLEAIAGGSAVFKTLIGLPGLAAAVAGAVCLAAIQFNLQQRFRMDQDEVRQLRQLVPSPPPRSVLMPLRIDNTASHTGRYHFDEFAIGGFATFWSAEAMVQQAYHRRDISSTYYLRWGPLPITEYGPAGLCYRGRPAPWYRAGGITGAQLRWGQVIPFVIDRVGVVHLVEQIWIERHTGRDDLIPFPRRAGERDRQGRPPCTFVLPDPGRDRLRPLQGWQWTATGKPVTFEYSDEWGSRHLSVAAHPVYSGDRTRAGMVVSLTPRTNPLEVCFRATITQWDLNRPWGDGIELIWYLAGRRDSPLATLSLKPQQVAEERRWVPVTVTVPAHQDTVGLHLEVSPGPAGNTDFDACRITPGEYEEPETPGS